MVDIKNIIIAHCNQCKTIPNAIGLVDLIKLTELSAIALKAELNKLVKSGEIKYYQGINFPFFYVE